MTELEEGSISRGTKDLFETLLADMGVEAEVASWSLEPYRSNYYTDFLGEIDWRDIWQLVWKTRLITTEDIVTFPEFEGPYIETEAFDDTASFENTISDAAVVGCLIVSDFKSDTALLRAKSAIISTDFSDMWQKYSVGRPVFSYSLMGKYKQLQVDIGKFSGNFFAQGADYAEQVLELCKQAGGTVHFQNS